MVMVARAGIARRGRPAVSCQAMSSELMQNHRLAPRPHRNRAWVAFRKPPRPANYARSVFHFGGALSAVVALELIPNSLIVLALATLWAAFAWSMEALRRLNPSINTALMRFFGPVAHEHETVKVNSATWYSTALLLLALTQWRELIVIGVAVLGVGDPLAGLVGRRFGRTKLLHGRSLEGSLAFVLGAALVSFALLRAFHSGALSWQASAVAALCASVAGAAAELLSWRFDDNFTIPLSAAVGAGIVFWLM